MTNNLIKITKEIVNKYNKLSVDELLKLPEPIGYKFIDDIYDQIMTSRKSEKSSAVVRVNHRTNADTN